MFPHLILKPCENIQEVAHYATPWRTPLLTSLCIVYSPSKVPTAVSSLIPHSPEISFTYLHLLHFPIWCGRPDRWHRWHFFCLENELARKDVRLFTCDSHSVNPSCNLSHSPFFSLSSVSFSTEICVRALRALIGLNCPDQPCLRPPPTPSSSSPGCSLTICS